MMGVSEGGKGTVATGRGRWVERGPPPSRLPEPQASCASSVGRRNKEPCLSFSLGYAPTVRHRHPTFLAKPPRATTTMGFARQRFG
jgi:hypothetical protein